MSKSTVILKFARFFASGFGIGHSPVAPGTCGTLLWLGLWLAMTKFGLILGPVQNLWLLLILLALALWSVKTCLNQSSLQSESENSAKQLRDPKYIVIDEWVGMQIALLPVSSVSPLELMAAFTLFRFFDILKPGPVRWVEDLSGAWGVILDDCVAGLISALVLAAVFWFLGT